jgi:hypothetical protein
MSLRTRLHRLEVRLGPPSDPTPLPTTEELVKRLEWWLGGQTYNRGVFDDDPNFRPAWSRYQRLWEIHTGVYSSARRLAAAGSEAANLASCVDGPT